MDPAKKKKGKKRSILIFLGVYFIISVGLAAAYMMDLQSPLAKQAAAEKKAKVAEIHDYFYSQRGDHTFTEDKAEQVFKAAYGPQGAVMSVNLTLLMQVVNFAAFLGLLYLLLWERLVHFLDERRQGIHDQLDDAKKKHQDAEKVLQEYHRKLAEARDDVARMIDDGKKRAHEEEKRLLEKARTEASGIREQAEADILTKAEQARRALRGEISSMSVAVAARILGREVKEDDHSQFIKQAIAEIDEQGID